MFECANSNLQKPRGKEGSCVETVLDSDMSHVSSDNESQRTAGPTDVPVSSDIEATSEISHNVAPPEVHDLGNLESQIPGLRLSLFLVARTISNLYLFGC